jgi:hypothetical protein
MGISRFDWLASLDAVVAFGLGVIGTMLWVLWGEVFGTRPERRARRERLQERRRAAERAARGEGASGGPGGPEGRTGGP